jgi:crossover junction endodeoxyribonuclease RusA
MLLLELPHPPSVNTYWRANGNRRYISPEGMKFKKDVAEYVIKHEVPKLGSKRLKVLIFYHPRDKRRSDLDNRLKGTLDALQDAGVYDDDEQIDHLTIQRGEIKSGGGITVAIETLE